jgi:hypothetical protein
VWRTSASAPEQTVSAFLIVQLRRLGAASREPPSIKAESAFLVGEPLLLHLNKTVSAFLIVQLRRLGAASREPPPIKAESAFLVGEPLLLHLNKPSPLFLCSGCLVLVCYVRVKCVGGTNAVKCVDNKSDV